MRRQHPDNFGEMDEHDSPTEPMVQVVLSPFSSTTPYSNGINGASTVSAGIPTPASYEQPFPQESTPNYPQPGMFYQHPDAQVYPVLPPISAINNGRPAG